MFGNSFLGDIASIITIIFGFYSFIGVLCPKLKVYTDDREFLTIIFAFILIMGYIGWIFIFKT